jgi:hypothetical protein
MCVLQSNCYDPFMDLSLPIPKGRRDLSGLKLRDTLGGQCTLDDCLQVLLLVFEALSY